jgi:hypothetical protein
VLAPGIIAGKPCFTTNVASIPMYFDFQDTVTDLPLKATQTSNVSSYKAGSATAPVSRTSTVTITDKFGDAVTGGSVVFHGAGETNWAATAASGNALTLVGGTNFSVTHFPADADVCFGVNVGTSMEEFTAGTVYAVKSATNADPTVVGLALGDTGGVDFAGATASNNIIAVTGTPTIQANLALAHPTFGCAARTVSPAGTASVAWNDVTTTSGADIVGWSYGSSQAVIADNAQTTATTLTGTKTAYRWVAPSATALASQTTATWKEVSPDWNDAADFGGTPVEVDYVNNSMVVELDHGVTVAAGTAARGGNASLHTFVSYSWDDNDYYYLNSAAGVTTTPTSMAGFEGAYVAGVATYGLLGAKATGYATATYAAGTLDAITYQALAPNVSIWKLGG